MQRELIGSQLNWQPLYVTGSTEIEELQPSGSPTSDGLIESSGTLSKRQRLQSRFGQRLALSSSTETSSKSSYSSWLKKQDTKSKEGKTN